MRGERLVLRGSAAEPKADSSCHSSTPKATWRTLTPCSWMDSRAWRINRLITMSAFDRGREVRTSFIFNTSMSPDSSAGPGKTGIGAPSPPTWVVQRWTWRHRVRRTDDPQSRFVREGGKQSCRVRRHQLEGDRPIHTFRDIEQPITRRQIPEFPAPFSKQFLSGVGHLKSPAARFSQWYDRVSRDAVTYNVET